MIFQLTYDGKPFEYEYTNNKGIEYITITKNDFNIDIGILEDYIWKSLDRFSYLCIISYID